MPDAVIVDAVRTPIGRAAKGSLKDVRADDLAAVPLRALVERNPEVDFAQTTDILMGCGFPMGEQGYNVGRNAQLLAGIDHHVPAVTVSAASAPRRCRRCGWPSTRSRPARATSTSPPASRPSRASPPHPPFDPHPRLDGSEGAPFNVYIPMGLTAENVAKRCSVTREAQDEWAATLPAARRRGARRGPLRPRDRPRDARGRHAGDPGRRAARGHDGRGARPAQAGVRSRRARSRPATPARSTTARPRCS